MDTPSLRIQPDEVMAPAWEGICPKCESGYFCEEQAEDPGYAPCPSCVSESDPHPGEIRWVPIVACAEYPDLSTQSDHFRTWGPWSIWSGDDSAGPGVDPVLTVQVLRRSKASDLPRILKAGKISWKHHNTVHDVLTYRVESSEGSRT